ncbi:MAG TPA: nucleoside 2-deoxyribosyltransferase domain-containing protein [Leptospiraceae bacterium]|nr:nucleoside 2-deoxyribosyltransferase domain-containing protein [Leptospiraceae bacterium]
MTDNIEQLRVLYSRNHTTVFPRLGVFLAGPTPPTGEMLSGWRRKVIQSLCSDNRLDPSMTVVAPEPESGNWSDINILEPNTKLTQVLNKQIPWELQYLNLCDITAFWFPSYWKHEQADVFPANIGPTSRFEFGFFLQEYLKNPLKRKFIIGSPEDSESIKWAKRMTEMNGIKWHTLKSNEKHKLVADSFIEEIAQTLIQNKWEY